MFRSSDNRGFRELEIHLWRSISCGQNPLNLHTKPCLEFFFIARGFISQGNIKGRCFLNCWKNIFGFQHGTIRNLGLIFQRRRACRTNCHCFKRYNFLRWISLNHSDSPLFGMQEPHYKDVQGDFTICVWIGLLGQKLSRHRDLQSSVHRLDPPVILYILLFTKIWLGFQLWLIAKMKFY